MTHPSVLELLSLAAGEASASPAAQHVATCAPCRQIVELHAPLAPTGEPRTAELGPPPPIEPSSPCPDLPELPVVDRTLYTRWEELAHGQGGMGRTLRAWDRRLRRTVAIKELLPPTGVDGVARDSVAYAHLCRRFEHEARLTARLDHPSIVSVHEAGQWPNGEPFYAMRLVGGAPLDQAIGKRATLAERLELLPSLIAATEAVAYAHDQAIVHRDLKPANILLGPFGETVVIDWGIAKDLRATSDEGSSPMGTYRQSADGLTQVGIGTPQYMPPEQALGQSPKPTFDVYALGATLYHIILGSPPYGNLPPTEVRRRLVREAAPPLGLVAPEAPPELCDVVDKAMARAPSERFQSALELAEELRRFQTGQLTKTRRYTPGELLRHWARRHKGTLRVAVAAALALSAVGGLSLSRVLRERTRAEESERRAQRELQKALGQTASLLATRPARRLEATALGVRAVSQGQRLGGEVEPEALQGLVDALAGGPLLATLRGHRGTVRDFAYLNGGSALATTATDRTIRLWDPRSGRLLDTLSTRLTAPDRLRASSDGRYLLAFGPCDDAELWDLTTRQSTRLACRDEIPGAGFTPEGQHAITADADAVTAWSLVTGAAARRLPIAQKASALGVASSRATPYAVAVGLMSGALILWDDRSGAAERLEGHSSEIRQALFTRDSRGLLTADAAGKVLLWDLGSTPPRASGLRDDPATPATLTAALAGEHLALLARDGARLFDLKQPMTSHRLSTGDGFGFSPQGEMLYGVSLTGVLHGWDATTGSEVLRFAGPADAADAILAFSGRGGDERLASAGKNGTAYLWDRREGIRTGVLVGHASEITWASWTPDGELVTASLDGTLRRWDLADGRAKRVLGAPTELVAASASADGSRVAAAGLDGRAYVFGAGGEVDPIGEPGEPLTRVVFSPDGQRLLGAGLDGVATLWDASARARLQRLDPQSGPTGLGDRAPGPGAVTAAAFRPDGELVVTGYADGSARLWRATTGALSARLPSQEPEARGGVSSAFFSPDGATVLLGLGGGSSLLCDPETLAPIARLEGRSASATGSPFSPDGQAVATVVGDGRVLINPTDRGRPPIELDGHSGLILSTLFSPDGARLVTAAIDGTVRLWDVAARANPLTIPSIGEGEATWASLSPDGRWLVATYATGALRLLPASADSALQRGCETLAYFERLAEAEGGCPSPIITNP